MVRWLSMALTLRKLALDGSHAPQAPRLSASPVTDSCCRRRAKVRLQYDASSDCRWQVHRSSGGSRRWRLYAMGRYRLWALAAWAMLALGDVGLGDGSFGNGGLGDGGCCDFVQWQLWALAASTTTSFGRWHLWAMAALCNDSFGLAMAALGDGGFG